MSADARSELLALPAEARAHLARESRGPGWYMLEGMTGSQPPSAAGWHLIPDRSSHMWALQTAVWLPCDPCEVLRVAAALGTWGVWDVTSDNTACVQWLSGNVECGRNDPLSAAVSCYAAAWKAAPTKPG